MSEEPKRIRPFNEGKLAFLAGKSLDDNPYSTDEVFGKTGYTLKQMWKSGFENEQLEYECSRSPKPDQSLIMEAEILIPQSSDWHSHELSRYISYYKESCKEGSDKRKMIINEMSLRRQIVRARLEKHLK